MQLQNLFKRAHLKLPAAPQTAEMRAIGDICITRVTDDSRAATENSLFVAVDGHKVNGSAYIADAVKKGACVVISKNGPDGIVSIEGRDVLHLFEPQPRCVLSALAFAFFHPAPKTIAAITGTNGKTSTAEFLRQIWHLQGERAASLGTLGLVSDDIDLALPSLTTQGSVTLAQTLKTLASHQINHVALEASSHGLDQHRLDGLSISRAGFSNLTRDHLDYHGSIEAYRAAKLRLFGNILQPAGVAAVNADMDPETVRQLHHFSHSRGFDLRTVGIKGEALRLIDVQPTPEGQIVRLSLYGSRLDDIHLPLIGRVQVDNVLLAAALAWEGKDAARHICTKLAQLYGVPGRCEHIATLSHGASVFVDYAHTPDALAHLLRSLRPHARGRLTVVFGAGGDRDRGKRPLMGAVASELADHCIVTDDNPRNESPDQIRREVRAGCPDALEIGDRAEAIAHAIKSAAEGDIIVIAGKGHESGQTIAGHTLPFNDAEVIRNILSAKPPAPSSQIDGLDVRKNAEKRK